MENMNENGELEIEGKNEFSFIIYERIEESKMIILLYEI